MAAGEFNRAELLRRRVERPRLADMAEDFGILAAELERCFGGTGTMPTRAQLRAVLRSDLEKAIAAHGGPKAVSKKLGWRLAYQVHCLLHQAGCQGKLTLPAAACRWFVILAHASAQSAQQVWTLKSRASFQGTPVNFLTVSG